MKKYRIAIDILVKNVPLFKYLTGTEKDGAKILYLRAWSLLWIKGRLCKGRLAVEIRVINGRKGSSAVLVWVQVPPQLQLAFCKKAIINLNLKLWKKHTF